MNIILFVQKRNRKKKIMRYCENDLDNGLWNEFSKEIIDGKAIRELVAKGANINAVDECDYTLLKNFICNADDSRENDMIAMKLLLDLGADINYISSNGNNCLGVAAVPWRIKIFKMLLERGINPNSICVEPPEHETVLDNLLFHEAFNWSFFDFSDNEIRKAKIIIKILKAYGGKKSKDLHTDKINKYLVVNALYPTGLVTWDGYIDIQNIPNITQKLKSTFLNWIEICSIPQGEFSNTLFC